jgi:hypothetical protein
LEILTFSDHRLSAFDDFRSVVGHRILVTNDLRQPLIHGVGVYGLHRLHDTRAGSIKLTRAIELKHCFLAELLADLFDLRNARVLWPHAGDDSGTKCIAGLEPAPLG